MALTKSEKRTVLETLTNEQIMAVAEDVTSEPARLEYRDVLLRRIEATYEQPYDPDSWDAQRCAKSRMALAAAKDLAAAKQPGPATRIRELYQTINRLSRGDKSLSSKQIENVWRGVRTYRQTGYCQSESRLFE